MVGSVLLITLLLFATETTFTKQLGSKKVKKINFCLQKSNLPILHRFTTD
jgi:hypothetical protein